MNKQNNNIDNIRNEIKKYFDPLSIKEDTRDLFFSPDNKYRIETIGYHQNKTEVNWDITNVVVKDNITGELQAEIYPIALYKNGQTRFVKNYI